MTEPKHPAKFSPNVLGTLNDYLGYAAEQMGVSERRFRVLDPFAGTGRVHHAERFRTFGIELEPEWANMHERTQVGDATDLPFRRNYFHAAASSPCYANRFSDSHNARDGSRRRSYTHDLGRKLTPGNAGAMPWGAKYRILHVRAWQEVYRVVMPGGFFVLNISDHYKTLKRGQPPVRQRVSAWHIGVLLELGFDLLSASTVDTPRHTDGANAHRIEGELVLLFQKGTP